LRFLGTGDVGFIPISIIFLAIMTGIAAIVLKKTVLGRQIYTIGGNVSAAILSGFNVGFIIIISYVISGFTAGIAGIFLAGWIGISDNWVGRGYELDSIAAVVMGGTSLHGGRGGVWGTIAGVLILIMLYNIVLILHFPSKLQIIVKGIVIIAAASFWSLKRS
jgi:ribose/xylose/arabinose/galactoside ABC-type transport system permease subunit